MTGKAKGTVYALICVALWALIPVVAKLGQTTLDNHQFLFWSSLVSFVVLSATTILSGNIKHFKRYSIKDFLYLTVLGLLGTYVYYLFLYLGYSQATGLEVLVVQYTWPIVIVVLSVFLLKEPLSVQKVVAIALGFAGVVTVLTKGNYTNINISNGSVIALVAAGAFCFALFSVLSKSVRQEPLGVTSLYFLSAGTASFFSMLYFSEFALPSTAEIAPILLNGVLVNGFSYVLWLAALRRAEASYLAPFIFLTPILSALYLVLFFNEPVLLVYGVGLALVVASGLVNSLQR